MAEERPSAEALESVCCNLCSSWETRPFMRVGSFHVVQCVRCHLVYENPRPASTANGLYEEAYFHSGDSEAQGYDHYLADEANLRRAFRERLRMIERTASRDALLDVGCAYGFSVDEARKRGWSASGVEISRAASEYARNTLHLDVSQGDLTNIRFADQRFSVVTLWETFEHVPDPKGTLREIHRILKAHGWVILSLPDVSSPMARLMRRQWTEYKAPEHFYYFSKRALRRMLDEVGFEVHRGCYLGKYISTAMLLARLAHYAPWLSRLVGGAIRLCRLEGRSWYANSFGIWCVMARKR